MKDDKNRVLKWLLKVSETLENSQLEKEKLNPIHDEVVNLRTYLKTENDLQTYLFTIIFIKVIEDKLIDLKRLMAFLNLQLKDHIFVVDAIDRLFEKKFLKIDETRRGPIIHSVLCDFTIRKKVLNAILNCEKIDDLLLHEQNDIFGFVNEVSAAVNRHITANNKIELYELIEKIESENSHLGVIAKLKKMAIGIEYRTFLYELGHNCVVDLGRPTYLKTKLFFVFGVREGLILLKDFIDKQTAIQQKNLIELTGSEFADDVEVRLTDFATELIFDDEAKLLRFKQTDKSIQTDFAPNMELFFDADLKKQLDFIEKITQKSNFMTLQFKLIENGMAPGIVVLFYGEAGVGKSAVIRSIANRTGRTILEVQGSQKDKYYGETEKRTKAIFDDYNAICNRNKEDFPIMVIDEADQLITRRLENTTDQTDNTSNSQQNIILTALERNRGIIFLTTNMVGNMLDAGALERRINFKVEFKRPSEETTFKVWKSNLSFLDDKQINYLNKNYQLSPGQINNIQKKVIFDEVIENKTASFDKIIGFCNSERGIRKDRKSIGFKTR